MGQSEIVTIGRVFILSDVFLGVAVVIAKAPYLSKHNVDGSKNVL